MMNGTALTEEYRRHRETLLAEFPELNDDGETLADTLDGLTDLPDVVTKLLRAHRSDKAMADALATMLKEMGERKARLIARAERAEAIALSLMLTAGLPRVERPDFTASIRSGQQRVVVTDEAVLPDAFVKVTRTANKIALREALGRGEAIPGALLGNGSPTLQVRTR